MVYKYIEMRSRTTAWFRRGGFATAWVGKSKEMCEKVGISGKCASSQAEDRLMNFMVWFGCVVELGQGGSK